MYRYITSVYVHQGPDALHTFSAKTVLTKNSFHQIQIDDVSTKTLSVKNLFEMPKNVVCTATKIAFETLVIRKAYRSFFFR